MCTHTHIYTEGQRQRDSEAVAEFHIRTLMKENFACVRFRLTTMTVKGIIHRLKPPSVYKHIIVL